MTPLMLLCISAGLQSFWMDGVDWCQSNEVNFEKELVLRQVEHLHTEAAKVLEFPSGRLPFNYTLEILKDDRGPLASSASKGRIEMVSLPKGKNWKLNEGLYLHELGHVIAASEDAAIPEYLRAVGQNALTVEAFADLLSISVSGAILTEDETIPPCLNRARYLSESKSFKKLPVGFFLPSYVEQRILSCCNSKKVFQAMQPEWKEYCETQIEGYRDSSFTLDRRKMDHTSIGKDLVTKPDELAFDPHQIGLPINSFLAAFAKTQKMSLFQVLKSVLTHTDEFTKPLRCALNGHPVLKLDLPRATLSGLLRTYRKSLSLEVQKAFDREWKRYGLKTLVLLEYDNFSMEQMLAVKRQMNAKVKIEFPTCAGKVSFAIDDRELRCGVSCESFSR